jgi:two-component system LytT family sensor kinase
LINWTNCFDCNISPKEVEKYTARYTLSITLDEENYTKKELIIYALIVTFFVGLVALIIIYIIKKRSKKELKEKETQKNTAKLQLNSVRSQLNPHFLFNALAGIQNLMNKNDVDNANRYLSKFARLTRNVLDSKELISLTEEKTLLDDYLQMEQLRFGFQYTIKATEDLDVENIEIPTMLLQPFVENAVKHGISEKGNEGKIEINFEKQSSNLVLQIKDNGIGFDTSETYKGLGLALSKNRISLLNTVYKELPFVLDIQSSTNGTIVQITLTQWL